MSIQFKQHPRFPQGFSDTFERRFWKRVDKNGPIPAHRPELGQCWMWTAITPKCPYGSMHVGVGLPRINPHRASWLIHTGEMPTLWVLHKCDQPGCVRFDHLFLGTPQDNMDDKEAKHRGNHLAGEQKPIHILTWEKVREIRRLRATTSVTFDQLSRQFGVSANTVSLIVRNRKWKEQPAD